MGNLETISGLNVVKGQIPTTNSGTTIEPHHRQQAIDYLSQYLKDGTYNGRNVQELEEFIYQVSNKVLIDYISTFCHIKISLQNPFHLGKRNKISEIAATNLDEHLGKLIEFQWVYSRPPNKIAAILQGGEKIPQISFMNKEKNMIVEEKYHSSTGNTFSIDLDGFGTPVDVNLKDQSITYKNKTLKALKRVTLFQNALFNYLPFWKEITNEYDSFPLRRDNNIFLNIKKDLEENIAGIEVHSIMQIQNYHQARNFSLEINIIEMNDRSFKAGLVNNPNSTPSANVQLQYHGTCSMNPSNIISDREGIRCDIADPYPNQNWGKGAPHSPDPKYANERAYKYTHTDGVVHKQIFLNLVALGHALDKCVPDSTIKRPPVRANINHMPILYDSISGTYTSEDNGFSSEVNIVYKRGQVLPSFLIDYSINN